MDTLQLSQEFFGKHDLQDRLIQLGFQSGVVNRSYQGFTFDEALESVSSVKTDHPLTVTITGDEGEKSATFVIERLRRTPSGMYYEGVADTLQIRCLDTSTEEMVYFGYYCEERAASFKTFFWQYIAPEEEPDSHATLVEGSSGAEHLFTLKLFKDQALSRRYSGE